MTTLKYCNNIQSEEGMSIHKDVHNFLNTTAKVANVKIFLQSLQHILYKYVCF